MASLATGLLVATLVLLLFLVGDTIERERILQRVCFLVSIRENPQGSVEAGQVSAASGWMVAPWLLRARSLFLEPLGHCWARAAPIGLGVGSQGTDHHACSSKTVGHDGVLGCRQIKSPKCLVHK
ncbi:hypothetical protein V8F33_011632 [Rhypophila sp. PSN 637]